MRIFFLYISVDIFTVRSWKLHNKRYSYKYLFERTYKNTALGYCVLSLTSLLDTQRFIIIQKFWKQRRTFTVKLWPRSASSSLNPKVLNENKSLHERSWGRHITIPHCGTVDLNTEKILFVSQPGPSVNRVIIDRPASSQGCHNFLDHCIHLFTFTRNKGNGLTYL